MLKTNFTVSMTKKKKIIWGVVGIVIAGAAAAGYMASQREPKPEYTTADVTRGTLVQTVNETGTITPAKEIELNFMASGQLTKLDVKVGDQVKPDQPLAEIDYSSLQIRQREAEASLTVAQANLNKILAGATSQDIAIAQAGVAQAQAAYDAAKADYDRMNSMLSGNGTAGASGRTPQEQAVIAAESNLASTKTTYQRGIDNKSDALALVMETKLAAATATLDIISRIFADTDPYQSLASKNKLILSQARASLQQGRDLTQQANEKVAAAKAARTSLNLEAAYAASQSAINKTFETLTFMFSALENTTVSSNLSQSQITAYKASVDAQTTLTSGSISALQTARQGYDDARLSYDTNVLSSEQSLNQAKASLGSAIFNARNAVTSAQASLDIAKAQLDKTISSARPQDVALSQAQVDQAQASLELIKNQIEDNKLKSPIEGIITKVNYQVGEQVTPGTALLSVLTENNFQIEIDIAETDIAKIKLNDPAAITLDAVGQETVIEGLVYFIEPAATVIQGVTYYKVKISFDPENIPEVRSGMTADAVITTDRREDVLIMPMRAVVEKDGATFVRILENEVVRESPVSLGKTGDDGLVEVTSGVNEGDKVVTFVKESN